MATPVDNSKPTAARPMLGFLPAGIVRTIGEVVVTSIPGAILQFFFIVAAAGLNIWGPGGSSGGGLYALVYLPVVCLLPLVVGTVSTLVYERVRGTHTAHLKGSVLSSAMSGFLGSLVGALVIVITGLGLKNHPLGTAIDGPLPLVGVSLLIVAVSTVLAALGALVVVGVLNKMEK
ncbi:Uncharacterised protein [uncultured archaeon]|nr:Uncharacterised protein [uncultured archaeon]